MKVYKVRFDHYDYLLPKKNLPLEPAVPRDSSKLFIFDTKKDSIVFDYFYNLNQYLPNNSFLVLNNTKVLPARVTMKKSTGGKVILLFLVNELTGSPSESEGTRVVKVLADRKLSIGDFLYFDKDNYLQVVGQDENIFNLKFDFTRNALFSLLKKYGSMPIPPYLKETSLSKYDLIRKYQTIFAKKEGSAAAPTASLHFTNKVFERIKNKGIEKYFVTLHVGLGTFAPISEENIKEKKLHEEYFKVNGETLRCIDTLKQEGNKLVAVGTTVVRTLESLVGDEARIGNRSRQTLPLNDTGIVADKHSTDLFIFPPYDFKMVDILITNFHLPKSSLMMLVEAFLQHKKAKRSLVELYNMAIKNDFRFYSFGDAMFIL